MRNDQELEKRYLSSLDSTILDLAKKPGANLADVLRGARGAFPSLVIDRSKALGLEKLLRSDNDQSSIDRSAISPELHPLDFEWYFSTHCAETLAASLISSPGEILCLGAPTVAAAIAQTGEKVYLADRNPLLEKRFKPQENLRFILWDLYDPLPLRQSFPIVFFDAPWYLETIELWLWQASRIVQPKGLIVFSLFPSLLRPTAEYERHHILRQAEALGSVEMSSGILEYETPLFEYEALASCGINLNVNWRHADLVSVRVGNNLVSDVKPSVHPISEEWDSFVIWDQVVKLRNPVEGHKETILSPLDDCANFIYPSVSLREPSRNQVDLWTSRNRVARVGQRNIVLDSLRHLADNVPIHEIVDLPILSLIEQTEKDAFVSRLRLILDSPLEETNVTTHNCTEVL